VLDVGIRAGKELAHASVVAPPDTEWRAVIRAKRLEYLGIAIRMTETVVSDDEPITSMCPQPLMSLSCHRTSLFQSSENPSGGRS
jgi:hypothetical protein